MQVAEDHYGSAAVEARTGKGTESVRRRGTAGGVMRVWQMALERELDGGELKVERARGEPGSAAWSRGGGECRMAERKVGWARRRRRLSRP